VPKAYAVRLPGMGVPRVFRCFWASPEIIRWAVMTDGRYPLSLRNGPDLLHERGIDIRNAVPLLSPSDVNSDRPDHCRGRGLSETFWFA
jgi:hypothetical protein